MQAQDMERSLAALGQELQHLGVQKPLRLLLVGGAFMLTHIRNRRSTSLVERLLQATPVPRHSLLLLAWIFHLLNGVLLAELDAAVFKRFLPGPHWLMGQATRNAAARLVQETGCGCSA